MDSPTLHRRQWSKPGDWTPDGRRTPDESKVPFLDGLDYESPLPDPDAYHRISLQSYRSLDDPLEPLPTAHRPRSLSQPALFSRLTARFWKRRKQKPYDWRLSGETLISNWQEKSPVTARLSFRACLETTCILLQRLLVFFLPSFVQAHLFPQDHEQGPRKVSPTAYLDGLRGLAALSVFFFHTTNNIYDQVKYSYGAPLTEEDAQKGLGPNDSLFQLPIAKVLYAGPFAVSIFFIVSGFALSLKPIKQMRSHDQSGLLTTLQSSVFRRAPRLFLPCFVSTFIIFIVARMGAYDSTRFISEDPNILTGRWKVHLGRSGTFWEQFSDWFWVAVAMVKFFGWSREEFQGFYSIYDTHLWTIPIELRASLALFLVQLALARFRPSIRISITVAAIAWVVHIDRWEMMLFLGGYVLAELNADILNPSKAFNNRVMHTAYQCFIAANLVSGLYLASYPDVNGEVTPGYIFLASLVPETYSHTRRFWQGIGGLQIVLAVSSNAKLGKALSSAVPRYLGQISYALYLVHAMVNHTVGYWLFYLAYTATDGWANPLDKKIAFGACLFVETVVTIWVADVFWRFGDKPMVSFARWLEDICLDKP